MLKTPELIGLKMFQSVAFTGNLLLYETECSDSPLNILLQQVMLSFNGYINKNHEEELK